MRQVSDACYYVCLFLCSADAMASGRPVLDHHNASAEDSYINIGDAAYDWQQGITVGITGQLVRVDLFVWLAGCDATGPTRVSVSSGGPWQSGLPRWTQTGVLTEGWNTFDLKRAKIEVQAGQEIVLGVSGEGAFCFGGVGITYGDQYPGGDVFLNGELNSDVNDILFKTYVKQKGKPIPAGSPE